MPFYYICRLNKQVNFINRKIINIKIDNYEYAYIIPVHQFLWNKLIYFHVYLCIFILKCCVNTCTLYYQGCPKKIFSGYTYMVYSVLVWEAGLWTRWQTLTHLSLEYCRPSPTHWTMLNFDPDWRWCYPQCVENHCCLPAPGQREERGGWSHWGGGFCRTPQHLRMSQTLGWWWLTHLCWYITIAI